MSGRQWGSMGAPPVGFNGCASVGASDERLHDHVLKELADGVKNKAEKKDGQCCGVKFVEIFVICPNLENRK